MEYIRRYLKEVQMIVDAIDAKDVDLVLNGVAEIRGRGGRLFFLGVGGGAGNAAHAVNDFRKIACIESYAPTDNFSELSARINDEGWDGIFASWLAGSRLSGRDAIFVFSVGGGDAEKNISANIVKALSYAKSVGAKVFGIVGRDGGFTKKVADACIVVPTVNPDTVTPHAESFQAVLWHLIVTHPAMRIGQMKWEAVDATGGIYGFGLKK
ncbi:MAG: sugar isomerase [Deltaproteobacteria bacterium]